MLTFIAFVMFEAKQIFPKLNLARIQNIQSLDNDPAL